MSNKKKLQVLGVTFSQVQAGAYALILAEENGARRIPIIIGTPEAQSIAIFLEGLNPPRPLTHDLFVSLTKTLNITLKEVFIYKYEELVYFSELIFEDESGKITSVDSRTSDAIAIAIRTKSPIYIAEEILVETGVVMEDDFIFDDLDKEINSPESVSLDSMSLSDLQAALEEAISNEDYERASMIRDIINKKSSS